MRNARPTSSGQPRSGPCAGPARRRGAVRFSTVLTVLMALGLLVFWTGCRVTEKNYKTLSFWFDGVPDPNAPVATQGGRVIPTRGQQGPQPKIVSQHQPFVEKKCSACHDMAGQTPQFALAVSSCIKCHEKVPNQYPVMHGPVALGACLWCHEPHQSSFPVLLRNDNADLCTQCHDRELLNPDVEGHEDNGPNCLECHQAHGGPDRRLLRAKRGWPVTRPARPVAIGG